MSAWQPDRELLAALHDAARRTDPDTYLSVLLDTCVVMPGDPAAGRWAVAQTEDGPCVLVFSSPEALQAGTSGTQPYVVWPVFDLLYAWPDPGWSLLIDAGLPTEVVLGPEAVAQAAEWAVRAYPLDTALWAATGEPESYLHAIAASDVVVPIRPEGSPSRDLTDPDFAWWVAPDEPAIVLFTSPARLQARLGEAPWLVAAFVDVVRYWPDGHAALIDPDHHIGARLPAEVMAAAARDPGTPS